jgi:integrase
VVFQSGERFPVLLDRNTGMPLFEPCLFIVTQLRACNRASATLEQAGRAVMVFCLFLEQRGIDLDARLLQGNFLDLGEIDDLARFCRTSSAALDRETEPRPLSMDRAPKVLSAESVRMMHRSAASEVKPGTTSIRLRYIREYVRWLVTHRLLKSGQTSPLDPGLVHSMELALAVLRERTPRPLGRNSIGPREGLSPEELAQLQQVIDVACAENPWTVAHVRERNALIVHWLLALGVRRGELLGVRMEDINFQTNEVLIARRADDPTDPRRHQPNTKTHGRLLSLEEGLAQRTHRYILGARRQFVQARKHGFLFVANGSGAPLTLDALNKLFVALRNHCVGLPETLSPHQLRHTWNDSFSELMDRRNIPEEKEHKMRSRLMGWSETSKTAATYTKRHVRKKAREASLALQQQLCVRKPYGH